MTNEMNINNRCFLILLIVILYNNLNMLNVMYFMSVQRYHLIMMRYAKLVDDCDVDVSAST